MLLDLFEKHVRVDGGVKRQENLPEAGGESGIRGLVLGTEVCSSDFGSVARQELEVGLVVIELGHWGKNTLCVAGQEDDVSGMGTPGWQLHILQKVQWEGGSGVGGDGRVIEIDLSGMGVETSILDDTTVADGVIDFRLHSAVQVDNLGIASSFNVEDSIVRPASFIISNDLPLVRA